SIGVAILATQHQPVIERIFGAGTDGPAGAGMRAETADGRIKSEGHAGVIARKGDTTGDIGHEAVHGIAEARTRRRRPADAAFTDEILIDALVKEIRAAAHVGIGDVGVDADDEVIVELMVVADIDAAQEAGRIDIGMATNGIDIAGLAPAMAELDAGIGAGPAERS